ncbi:hypothetical protein F5878DRAFT_304051 [Lentinula raphanica]|uniref:Uncharacterized protein n=1 Tax=Lentinula raphanica TaxID=153919 RepID=A0AA38UEW1_9AGAR|nr:hypothetical protein F5878DRAFT_304051 [Lentinula raphanica]
MAEALNNSEIDSISDDEYSALTDVPIFLGYILSYFLSGILVAQFFLYFLAFYHKDPRHIKLTVFAVLVIELLSTIVATVIGLIAIVEDGFLSNAILSGGFKVLALMSGIACSIVQFFYCWRIHILGGHNMIIVVVMLLSVLQCVMISLSGFGVFQNGDILGAGDRTIKDPTILFINISWLAGTAVCDIIIAVTILYLQNRIITMQCPSIRWKMRAEKNYSFLWCGEIAYCISYFSTRFQNYTQTALWQLSMLVWFCQEATFGKVLASAKALFPWRTSSFRVYRTRKGSRTKVVWKLKI